MQQRHQQELKILTQQYEQQLQNIEQHYTQQLQDKDSQLQQLRQATLGGSQNYSQVTGAVHGSVASSSSCYQFNEPYMLPYSELQPGDRCGAWLSFIIIVLPIQ
jgi:nitric oxide reductase large subunit